MFERIRSACDRHRGCVLLLLLLRIIARRFRFFVLGCRDGREPPASEHGMGASIKHVRLQPQPRRVRQYCLLGRIANGCGCVAALHAGGEGGRRWSRGSPAGPSHSAGWEAR